MGFSFVLASATSSVRNEKVKNNFKSNRVSRLTQEKEGNAGCMGFSDARVWGPQKGCSPLALRRLCPLLLNPLRPARVHSPARLSARFRGAHPSGPPAHRESPESWTGLVARLPCGPTGLTEHAHHWGARTCAVGGAGPRAGRRRGWAAARAVDVFGGADAEGGGPNPEVGRRWSERARSAAQRPAASGGALGSR